MISPEVLDEIAEGGAQDSGGLPVALLGDFLSVLSSAVMARTPVSSRQLRVYRALGERAARDGVAMRALLDLYLSSAWRLWRHLPPVAAARTDPDAVVVAGEVMLHAVDDVVAALAEGFQLARRSLVREQESARREFIDDLLGGSANVVGVLQRAAAAGLDLSGPHAVAVVVLEQPVSRDSALVHDLERAVQGAKGDAQPLVATKDERLVIVFAAPDRAAIEHVTDRLKAALSAQRRAQPWQIALSRARVGADGVAAAYREALEAITLAARLGLTAPVIDAVQLLPYHVLLRDRAALADLVETTLGPLRIARGGAGPLLDTLRVYFGSGGNSARTARRLHLSVRAVTYRLGRVRALTGRDPAQQDDRFALQVAALGAVLLDWPG